MKQDEVCQMLQKHHQIVVKAPWSSSGRGVRFIDGEISSYHEGWIRNVILHQGSVIVEPYYHKVKDFGMEFYSDGKGNVTYLGLSLFQTKNGAYTGNIIAPEEEKQGMINRYISADLLLDIRDKVKDGFGRLCGNRYRLQEVHVNNTSTAILEHLFHRLECATGILPMFTHFL